MNFFIRVCCFCVLVDLLSLQFICLCSSMCLLLCWTLGDPSPAGLSAFTLTAGGPALVGDILMMRFWCSHTRVHGQ